MQKTWILINKPVCLGQTIFEISTMVMYEFQYHYVNRIYGEKTKLCYMIIYSFIVYIKTEENYVDIGKDVETKFNTSNYKLNGPLTKEKNKNVIALIKYKLGGK